MSFALCPNSASTLAALETPNDGELWVNLRKGPFNATQHGVEARIVAGKPGLPLLRLASVFGTSVRFRVFLTGNAPDQLRVAAEPIVQALEWLSPAFVNRELSAY